MIYLVVTSFCFCTSLGDEASTLASRLLYLDYILYVQIRHPFRIVLDLNQLSVTNLADYFVRV